VTVYEDILRYKTTHTYPADAMKAAKRRLREKSESFTVQETTLYHKGHKGKQQCVVQKDEVPELLRLLLHLLLEGATSESTQCTRKYRRDTGGRRCQKPDLSY